MSRRGRGRGDDGVVLVLMALLIVAMLTIAAIVIDLGQLRADRRENQTNADLAGLSAGHYLAGRASGAAASSDPRGGCSAAFETLKRNVPGFPAAAAMPCSSLPVTAKSPDCTATTPPITITATGSAPFQVRITYPVSDNLITDSRFAGGGANDGSLSTARCERMTIEVTSTRSTFFANVIGRSSQTIASRATVRGAVGTLERVPPAFLILERTNCDAFVNSVGGSSSGIIIRSPDGIQPGLAHLDSNGTGSNCSGSARTLVATPLPGGTPSFVVDGNTAGTEPGIIALNALSPGGNASYAYRTYVAPATPGPATSGGMSVLPTAGRVVSRSPVDQRYNPSSAATLSDLHTTARNRLVAPGAPAGATPVGCVSGNVTGTNLYVNCPNLTNSVTFTDATTVTFSGNVGSGGQTINLPQAETVVVRGRISSGAFYAPRAVNLYVGGGVDMPGGSQELRVNTTSSTGCTGGTSAATRFVIFGGDLNTGGRASICATSVYLAGPLTRIRYTPEEEVTGGSCTATLPCPKGSPANTITGGRLLVEGGGQLVLTAPNQFAGPPPAGSQGLEDLALWTESPHPSEVKSRGEVDGIGVFFFPNAQVDFRSPALATPRTAQFIARGLNLRQGTLEMRPASDYITIPVPGALSLIR